MPKDPNNIPENQNNNDTSELKPEVQPDANAASAETGSIAPQVVPGALNKALMRTFRGDISKNLGNKASDAISRLVPKGTNEKNIEAPTTQGNAPQQKNEAVVHTFKDDVQNLVRNQKMSMTRIAALESDRGRPSATSTEHEHKPWKITMLTALTVLFLVVGAVLAAGAYYAYQLNTAPNLAPQFEPSIIFTEARERLDITETNPRGVTTLLANARKNTLFSLGSLIELKLAQDHETTDGTTVSAPVDAYRFMKAIQAAVPETFLQTLGTDYMVGIHAIDENVPFIILTTQSYGHAFSGMLEWERHLEEDLTPFFSPGGALVKPASAEGQNTFSDTVIENLDVRMLRDSEKNIRILYTFTDRNTVVITTNIRTLVELASRLRVQ